MAPNCEIKTLDPICGTLPMKASPSLAAGSDFETPEEDLDLTISSDKDGILSSPVADSDMFPSQHLHSPLKVTTLPLRSKIRSLDQPVQTAWLFTLVGLSVTNLAITPNPAYTNDELLAQVTSYDPEGDIVEYSYTWNIDGNEVNTQNNALPSTFTERDDVVLGYGYTNRWCNQGEPVSSSTLVIQNSPPTAPVVSLTPSIVGEPIYCTISTESTDADNVTSSPMFALSVNGSSFLATQPPTPMTPFQLCSRVEKTGSVP